MTDTAAISPYAFTFDVQSVTGLNVKSFGAKGDGTTDDTAAIQSAIASAASGLVGTVIASLPSGNFLHSGTLTVPANVILSGSGKGLTILTRNQATGDSVRLCPSGYTTATSGNSYVTFSSVRNLTLRTSVTKTAGAMIRCVNAIQCGLYDILIDSLGGGLPFDGIYLDGGPAQFNIARCEVIGSQAGNAGSYVQANYAQGSGIRMWALAFGSGHLPGSDIWISGGNQVQGFLTGISIEGNCGGIAIDDTDVQLNVTGIQTSVATGSGVNRELFLGQRCFVDSNALFGCNIGGTVAGGSGQTLNILTMVGGWCCGNGRFGSTLCPGVTTNGQGAGLGFGLGIDGANTSISVSIAGGKIYSNAGSGIQMGAGNLTLSSAIIDTNGQLGQPGQGVYLGNISSFTATGNLMFANSLFGVALIGAANHVALTGNTLTGNTSGATSGLADNGTTIRVTGNAS